LIRQIREVFTSRSFILMILEGAKTIVIMYIGDIGAVTRLFLKAELCEAALWNPVDFRRGVRPVFAFAC